MNMASIVLLVALPLILLLQFANADYEVPEVLIEALSPKGFKVSIPDEDGISLFAFHGKINEEMEGREAGKFSVDVIKAKNGRWTYFAKSARLKVGDVIYYWVNVDYDDGTGKRGYIKDDQSFVVNELIPDDSATPKPTTSRPTPRPTTTSPPDGTCKPSPTTVNGKSACKGKLIFTENFSAFAKKKWTPEVKFAGDPDYEFVIYQNNPENLYVSNDLLHIRPTLTEKRYGDKYVSNSTGLNLGADCTGIPNSADCYQSPVAWQILPPVISSQISTKNHLSFAYGSIEVRAKLPKGNWLYPQIQLVSRSDTYGAGYESGRITIAFVNGNSDSSKSLSGGCVLGQSVTARNYGVRNIKSQNQWTNDFHVFRLDWKTDSITVSVDGYIYGNVYPPEEGFASEAAHLEIEPDTAERWQKGTKLAPFDSEMYLLLGVGAGGQCFPNRDDNTKPWDNDDPKAQLNFYKDQSGWSQTWKADSELLVDYVKIWAL